MSASPAAQPILLAVAQTLSPRSPTLWTGLLCSRSLMDSTDQERDTATPAAPQMYGPACRVLDTELDEEADEGRIAGGPGAAVGLLIRSRAAEFGLLVDHLTGARVGLAGAACLLVDYST